MSVDILAELKANFPNCWFRNGIEFDPNCRAVVWSGEGSDVGGLPAFDYYSTDNEETTYTMGVINTLNSFVEEYGYYWEAYDPGTYLLYKI